VLVKQKARDRLRPLPESLPADIKKTEPEAPFFVSDVACDSACCQALHDFQGSHDIFFWGHAADSTNDGAVHIHDEGIT